MKEVRWCPPIGNSYKLNVDGNSIGNPGNSGFGGLIRNSCGEWITGFSGFCGFSNNMNAELLAIAHGLNQAWNLGCTDIVCESDSQTSLELIQNG